LLALRRLAESWDAARAELSLFADTTRQAEVPARVQMRLLQELRAQKRPHQFYRRTGMVAAMGIGRCCMYRRGRQLAELAQGSRHIVANRTIPAVSNAAQSSPRWIPYSSPTTTVARSLPCRVRAALFG